MPVMMKPTGESLLAELDARWARLRDMCAVRKLHNPGEGCKCKASFYRWSHPENRCATIGSASDIRMAVEDFKTILAEYKKLK